MGKVSVMIGLLNQCPLAMSAQHLCPSSARSHIQVYTYPTRHSESDQSGPCGWLIGASRIDRH
jgi:hypothetical protein